MLRFLRNLVGYILLLGAGDVAASSYTPRTISSSFQFTQNTASNASTLSRYDSSASTCSIQRHYCTLQGSGHALDGLRDVCVLWDQSCSGSKALAAQEFMPEYNKKLQKNFCFFNPSPPCTASNPPGRMSALAAARDWMRSPQCSADKAEAWPQTPTWNGSYVDAPITFSNWTCCGPCVTNGYDVHVELFYWQDANADTSCLSIIGNNNSLATEGATRDLGGHPYFGCTSFGSHTSTVITTATLLLEEDKFIRVNYYNPWDPSPCGNSSGPFSLDTSGSSVPASTFSRAHPLIITDSKATTLVSGQFTFTSPSIYANFRALAAYDNCGALSFSSRILAFSPGELSTFVGQIKAQPTSSAPFNPADLPCPPRSIMSEQWYTPVPGISYLPNFILPNRISQSVPEFQTCVFSDNGDLRYAFDPPIALQPAAALDGPITPNAPIPASTITPAPSAIPNLGVPEQTGPSQDPAPSPSTNTVQASANPQPESAPEQIGSIFNTDLANDPINFPASVIAGLNHQQQQQSVDPSDPSQDPDVQPQIPKPSNIPNIGPPNEPSTDQDPIKQGQQGHQDPNQNQPADPTDPPQDPPSSQASFLPFAPLPSIAGGNPIPTQTQAPQQLQPAATSPVFTLGSITFTANPTAFPVAPGTILSAGSSGVVVAGTPLSLDPSGVLIIGSSRTVNLAVSQDPLSRTDLPLPAPLVVTMGDGQSVAVSPVSGGSGGNIVVVDGKTLSAGGAGATIDATGAKGSGAGGGGGGPGVGWFVSLGLGRTLDIGTTSVALPTMATGTGGNWNLSASSGTGRVAVFTGEGAKMGFGVIRLLSWRWGLLVVGGWGIGWLVVLV